MLEQNSHPLTLEKNVAGVVILYYPDETILDNIESYIKQIGLLLIIDNSEKIGKGILDKIKLIPNSEYISNNQNLGVAEALNIAAKLATEKGFKYLLTMDQDSKASSNYVESLLSAVQGKANVGIIAPLHTHKFGTHLKPIGSVQKVIITMTSGNLLSLDAYKKLGKFRDEFFIDYIDIEYCFRMYLNKYNIWQVNDVILEHNEANISEVKFFTKKIHPHNHKPFRFYYKTRNLLYLRKEYKNLVPNLLKIEYKAYFMTIIRMILFEEQKLLKLKFIIQGCIDYFYGKKGKKNI